MKAITNNHQENNDYLPLYPIPMRYIPAISFLAAVLFCGLCIQPVLAISADEWVNSGNDFNQRGWYQEATGV
jgi:hypothetical protein